MWQHIDEIMPDDGSEIVIRLKNPDAGKIGFVGASIHQMARWGYEGDIMCMGRAVPREYIEAAFPLPPFVETQSVK